MTEENLPDYFLKYDSSDEAKQRVFDIVLTAFKKLGSFSGESLQQCDHVWEKAPLILTELAEEGFRFEVDWK